MSVRPMSYDDVPAVEQLTAAAFYELSRATRPANWPPPEPRSAERSQRWRERLAYLVGTDGPGCWVAEQEGAVVGTAVALLRAGLWGLSSFAVRPDAQARGLGKQLLESALAHGPWSAGLICSSHDPRAFRRYRLAGFDLHPAMLAWGRVARDRIPALPGLREGTAGDIGLLDAIDRAARGYGRGHDHEVIFSQQRLVVVECGASRAYAYALSDGSPYLVAGTDPDAAATAMWGALAQSTPDHPVTFSDITSHQTWAVDAALSAGLELHNYGYVAVRGMAPPTPYLPSAHFL